MCALMCIYAFCLLIHYSGLTAFSTDVIHVDISGIHELTETYWQTKNTAQIVILEQEYFIHLILSYCIQMCTENLWLQEKEHSCVFIEGLRTQVQGI